MFWRGVERLFLPFYQKAYTVGPALAQLLSELHGMPFGVVRNVPMPLAPLEKKPENGKKILLYQGALNEGRGIEALIGAMGFLPDHFELHLAGEGDLSQTLRQLAAPLGEKVRFWGFIQPDALRQQTHTAWLGLNLLENKGKSYYYSLANKYFDYVQARVPVMTMAFPEYLALQARHRVALLLERLEPREIAQRIMDLEQNPEQYAAMVQACEAAACEWHWGKEAELLLNIWQK
jgi:glycosyltransferase involved in cell wall biosynthesis